MRVDSKRRDVLLIAVMVVYVLGGFIPVQAEEKGLTPAGKVLFGAARTADKVMHPSYDPVRLQADCSADLEACWKAYELNKDNVGQVMDLCWQETKTCPQVCKDQYTSHRKEGMKAPVADNKALFGKPSCIPGLDEDMKASKKD